MPVGAGAWPWGTLVANLSGALLLGLAVTRLGAAAPRGAVVAPLLCTGLLGSYTTFATFVVEIADLLRVGRLSTAVSYGLVSVLGGVALAGLGIRLADPGSVTAPSTGGGR